MPFQLPERLRIPYVRQPIEQFNQLASTLRERYKEGESLRSEYEDVLGTLETAQDDIETRNAYSIEYGETVDSLLDEYNGAYESYAFQKELKKLNRKFAQDPRLSAMKATKEETDFERNFQREMTAKGKHVIDFNKGVPRKTMFDPETGEYTPYRHKSEQALDYTTRVNSIFSHIKGKYKDSLPWLQNVANFDMLISKNTSGITEKQLQGLYDEITEEFLNTDEGIQFAKLHGYNLNQETGESLYDIDDPYTLTSNEDIKGIAKEFVKDLSKKFISTKEQYNWRPAPVVETAPPEETEFPSPNDGIMLNNAKLDIKGLPSFGTDFPTKSVKTDKQGNPTEELATFKDKVSQFLTLSTIKNEYKDKKLENAITRFFSFDSFSVDNIYEKVKTDIEYEKALEENSVIKDVLDKERLTKEDMIALREGARRYEEDYRDSYFEQYGEFPPELTMEQKLKGWEKYVEDMQKKGASFQVQFKDDIYSDKNKKKAENANRVIFGNKDGEVGYTAFDTRTVKDMQTGEMINLEEFRKDHNPDNSDARYLGEMNNNQPYWPGAEVVTVGKDNGEVKNLVISPTTGREGANRLAWELYQSNRGWNAMAITETKAPDGQNNIMSRHLKNGAFQIAPSDPNLHFFTRNENGEWEKISPFFNADGDVDLLAQGLKNGSIIIASNNE